MDDIISEVQDSLIKINLGMKEKPRPIYVSELLKEEYKAKVVKLVAEFTDCFS